MPSAAMIQKHQGAPPSEVTTTSMQPSLFKSPKAAPRPAIADVTPESARSKRPVVIEREQWRLFVVQHVVNLFDVVQHVALRDEQILPAVVVEILEAHAPTGACRGEHPQASLQLR